MMQQPPKPTSTVSFPLSSALSRLLSIGIFALGFAYALYRTGEAQAAMGKAAYVADQAARYDKFYAQFSPGPAIVGFFMAAFFLLGYELLALGIRKLMIDPIIKSLRGDS